MFDAYTGTYNDLRNTIFYFPKLQAPHSVPVCGATCGMHMFVGFVDKISEHFRPAIRYGTLPNGSRDLYEMLPIYSSSLWLKAFDPPRRVPAATIWRNPLQQKHSLACCSNSGPCNHTLDTALKHGWRHDNNFIVMKCPLDGIWS